MNFLFPHKHELDTYGHDEGNERFMRIIKRKCLVNKNNYWEVIIKYSEHIHLHSSKKKKIQNQNNLKLKPDRVIKMDGCLCPHKAVTLHHRRPREWPGGGGG